MNDVTFEVGQVLAMDLYGDGVEAPLVVREVSASGVTTNDLRCGGVEIRLHPEEMTEKPRLVSPAPKHQQRWRRPVGVAEVQIVDREGALAVEACDYGATLCHSNVVDVARWLAARDYRCGGVENTGDSARIAEKLDLSVVPHSGPLVITLPELPEGNYIFKMNADGKAQEIRSPDGKLIGYALGPAVTDCTWTATIVGPPWREPDVRPMASLAFAVADIFAHPTRDTSRRYVDMAVKALRYEPFVKAVQATLISLVGDRVSVFPSASEIMATVDACRTWEHARGMIAPGKRTLNRTETRELTEIAKLAAWARVPTLDACDIGEIVAETYERVRATC